MRKPALLLFLLFLVFGARAQRHRELKPALHPKVEIDHNLSKADLRQIALLEDTLHALSDMFTYDTVLAKRQKACYAFIPRFVEALKMDNSFYYPFDSFETVSKIYPPDSAFRIFTWQLVLPEGNFRYYGVIQMRGKKLKIYPLYDASDTMTYHSQRILTNENWYGALYYNIIEKQAGDRPLYTLFGYKATDLVTRQKVVDILSFDDYGKPKFGAPIFIFHQPEDSMHYKRDDTLNRFFVEYNYKASTILNYDPKLEMIVFDHVAPPTDKARGATFSYVPDGTYEGWKWMDNQWHWVEKIFTFAINENDNPPIPSPVFGTPTKQPRLPTEDVGPR